MQHWLIIQESTRLLSTIMQCMRHPGKSRQARDGRCTHNLVLLQKAAQIDLDNTNMIQMNQVFPNHIKEEVINPLTVKKIVED
jgi:hypothetical protein